MQDQRIIQLADGWHFKIRGGNNVGPFADLAAAELALANYCNRWKQRTDAAPGRWRNWRRAPAPLATTPARSVDLADGPATAAETENTALRSGGR